MTDASSRKSDQSSTWIIDQIENGVASIEVDGGAMISVPHSILPRGVHEGDVLKVTIALDPEQKARLLAESEAQVARGGSGGKGNISL